LLQLRLNQRPFIQGEVMVFFRHATFFHEKCCTWISSAPLLLSEDFQSNFHRFDLPGFH